MKDSVQNELKKALSKCCLTLDGWVSNAVESYLGVTCHFIDNEFEFRSFALDLRLIIESHLSEYIHSQINEVLQEWDIGDKVINKLCEKYF